MNTQLTTFPILKIQLVDEKRFVEFWAARYPTMNDSAYLSNIDQPPSRERLLALFEWKNGGPIAGQKRSSIDRNYTNPPDIHSLGDRNRLLAFIQQPGGVIWRIFWLHCCDRSKFPIFDQHVYRSMRRLQNGCAAEIPTKNVEKAKAYVDEYLPFHATFKYSDKKKIDEALWSYGKYLKEQNAL